MGRRGHDAENGKFPRSQGKNVAFSRLLSPLHLSTQALSGILVIGEETKFIMKSFANMQHIKVLIKNNQKKVYIGMAVTVFRLFIKPKGITVFAAIGCTLPPRNSPASGRSEPRAGRGTAPKCSSATTAAPGLPTTLPPGSPLVLRHQSLHPVPTLSVSHHCCARPLTSLSRPHWDTIHLIC